MHEYIKLSVQWDLSEETLNHTKDLMNIPIESAINVFLMAIKSLGIGVCYRCGYVTCTILINKLTHWVV